MKFSSSEIPIINFLYRGIDISDLIVPRQSVHENCSKKDTDIFLM